MAIEIITKEDLCEFREKLLQDLTEILNSKVQPHKQWLKSSEVRKLLNISPSTLQNLRINGTINYTQIGAIYYYNYDEIVKKLNH